MKNNFLLIVGAGVLLLGGISIGVYHFLKSPSSQRLESGADRHNKDRPTNQSSEKRADDLADKQNDKSNAAMAMRHRSKISVAPRSLKLDADSSQKLSLQITPTHSPSNSPGSGDEERSVAVENEDFVRSSEPRVSLWAGVGANYVQFKQTSGSDLESGTFARMTAPTLSAILNVRFFESSHFQFEYHDIPGRISTSEAIDLDKKTYQWQTYVAEYQYDFYQKSRWRITLLTGLQIHYTPFLSVNNTSNGVSLLENEITNLSGGAKIAYWASDDYEYEALLRYQLPVASKSQSGADFHAHSSVMFAGSAGISRRLENQFQIGIFWFGQQQDFKYDFTRNSVSSSGQQTLFNSNVQIRFGYRF